jgi:iron complex outermembrane receptor protein
VLALAGALALAQSPPASADTRADARRYFSGGMRAISEGRLSEGIDLLLKAQEIRPHANVLFNVARAFAQLGNVEAAVEYYERYLESQPPDVETVEQRIDELKTRLRLRRVVDEGMVAIAQGRYAEGITSLRRANAQRPHPNLLFNIARAYEQAGDLQAAIENYQTYTMYSPADHERVQGKIAELTKRLDAKEGTRKRRPSIGGADPKEIAEIVVSMLREQGVVTPRPPGSPSIAATPSALGADVAMSSTTGGALEAKAGADYEEVVVTASRREQSPLDAPNAVTVLTDEDIRLSGARSIPDLLRRVPGMDVMAMSYSDWNVSMRGFNRRLANKILVLVDGRTVYQDFLGATLWSGLSIDLIDIERIEVVRGPGSAIYGAYAYTGIINIITKRPEQIDGSVMELSAGSRDALRGNYQYGVRKGAVGFRASVGYERGAKYDLEFDPERVDYTTTVELDPELSIDRFRGDGQAEYRLDGGGRVFLGLGAHRGSTEIYGVSALRNQNVDGLISNFRGGYDSDFFSVLVFWDRIRADSTPQFFPTGTPDPGSIVRADLIALEPVLRPTFSFLGEHQLVIGAEFRHKFIDWSYLDTSHEEDFFALFAQDQWAINEQFTALASARLDKHPLIGFLGSPRVALIYKPTSNQAVRLSAGTAFRQPTQAENYLNLSAASPVAGVGVTLVGSPELEAERIMTVDLGYLLQGDWGEFEVVAYGNRVDNLIIRGDLVPASPGEEFDPDVNGFIGARTFYRNDSAVFLAAGGEVSSRVYPRDGA